MANSRIPTFVIDPDGTLFTPAPRGSEVRPVRSWVKAEGAEKASPTGPQETDAEGVPLWEADVMAVVAGYGSTEALETIRVRWASTTKPASVPGATL